MVFRSYWTPRYAFDKVLYLFFRRAFPLLPWITPKSIRILKTHLNKHQSGLEVGSGHSTAWFAKRLKNLISLEHDPEWFLKVKEILKKKNIQNVDLQLYPGNDAAPDNSEYILYLKSLPASFDFIIIDGIYREQCAEILIDKLNPKGVLVLDDCQRFIPGKSRAPYALKANANPPSTKWESFIKKTNHWKKIRTTDGMRDNLIYFKP